MEPREAIKILMQIRDKYPLDEQEKEAVKTATGFLDSAAFTMNRIKGIVARRKKKQERINPKI